VGTGQCAVELEQGYDCGRDKKDEGCGEDGC